MEAHYTFDQGYLVAAPTSRTGDPRAAGQATGGDLHQALPQFLGMLPRDQHVNFSAVIYQNLGSYAGAAGDAGGRHDRRRATALEQRSPCRVCTNIKPTLFAIYGEPDRITMTGYGRCVGGLLCRV